MNPKTPAGEPDNLIDLINKLAPPPAPDPVSMVPQTLGWIVLGLIALGLVVWLAWRSYRNWRANAYRRAALVELAACNADPAAIADILRRTALSAWPREAVASLTGEDWLDFLDQTGGNGGFGDVAGRVLLSAPWRARAAAPSPELAGMAAHWIRHHEVEPREIAR